MPTTALTTQVSGNKIDIELLKKDVEIITNLFNKIDVTIDKLQEISSTLSKMVSIQEQRIEAQEVFTKDILITLETRRVEHMNDIKELNSRISTVNKELTEKIEESEQKILKELQALRSELTGTNKSLIDRILSIEGWKWMITGAVGVVVWLISQVNITKFFS
jgi:chromosome segregation ATPase